MTTTGQTALGLPTTPHIAEGPSNDGFFEDLGNTTPFLKMGFEGFGGGGKTRTMVEVAIGLHRRIGSKKPVIFMSTEKAGKFLKPLFARAKVPVLQRETKSPADLEEAMKRCAEGASEILCIDSMTHFWESFVRAYQEKFKKAKLDMRDWGTINPEWKRRITDPFVNDPYHCIMTGRAGYEYDSEEDEEGKRSGIFKTGIKMKAGGEFAYEPDVLVLMTRHEDVIGQGDKSVWREATVLKDRSSTVDGQSFKNPTYENFAPIVEQLLAEHRPQTTTPAQDSTVLFTSEEDKRAWLRRRDAALETIENELSMAWPGSTGGDKAMKLRALKDAFEETAWTKIQSMRPEILEAGLLTIHDFIEAQKVIEAIDADLLTVWPGASADAKIARRAALAEFWKAESVAGLDAKGIAVLKEGAKVFRAKYFPAPAVEEKPVETAATPTESATTEQSSNTAATSTTATEATTAATTVAPALTLGDLKRQAKRARMSHAELATRYAKDSLDDFTAADIAKAMQDLDGMIATELAA